MTIPATATPGTIDTVSAASRRGTVLYSTSGAREAEIHSLAGRI